MRWEIVHLYAYQGVRGWAELSRAPVLDGWSALTHSFDSPSPLCAPSTHGSCTGPHRHLGADALDFAGSREALRAYAQWPSAGPRLLAVAHWGHLNLLPSHCMYRLSLKPSSTHLVQTTFTDDGAESTPFSLFLSPRSAA